MAWHFLRRRRRTKTRSSRRDAQVRVEQLEPHLPPNALLALRGLSWGADVLPPADVPAAVVDSGLLRAADSTPAAGSALDTPLGTDAPPEPADAPSGDLVGNDGGLTPTMADVGSDWFSPFGGEDLASVLAAVDGRPGLGSGSLLATMNVGDEGGGGGPAPLGRAPQFTNDDSPDLAFLAQADATPTPAGTKLPPAAPLPSAASSTPALPPDPGPVTGAPGASALSAPPGGSPFDISRLHAETLRQFAVPPSHTLVGASAGSFRELLNGVTDFFHAGTLGTGARGAGEANPFSAGSFGDLLGPAEQGLRTDPTSPTNDLGQARQDTTLAGSFEQFANQIHNAPFLTAAFRPGRGLTGVAVAPAGGSAAAAFTVPGAGPRTPAAAPSSGTDPLDETGTVTFTVDETGSNATASFTLHEVVTLDTLTLHQDDSGFTLDEAGSVSFTYQETGTDANGNPYTIDQTGTDSVSTHDTDATAPGGPDTAGFNVDNYNQAKFWAPRGVTWDSTAETTNGTDSLSIHDVGTSTAPDGTTYNYTVDDTATDSFGDTGNEAGGTDTVTGDDNGGDHAAVQESGTTTLADGTVVQFNVSDATSDNFTDDGSGPASGTDTFTDDATGSDSATVQETGTSTDGMGDTVSFTVSDTTTDNYNDADNGTDNTQAGSDSDTFNDSDGGSDSFNLQETGTSNQSGLSLNFTVSDTTGDSFSDADNGSATDPSDGTDNFNDTVGGTDSFGIQENGTSTDSQGNSFSFSITDSAGDNFTSGDKGADTETNGSDSGDDGFTDSAGGQDAINVQESGAVLVNGALFNFSLSDATGDTFKAGDQGDENLATDGVSDGFSDSASGSDNFSVQATAASTDSQGDSVSFTVSDSTGDQFSDGDNGTDQEANNSDDVTDNYTDSAGGGDNFTVQAGGVAVNADGSGSMNFSLKDTTGDNFTAGDNGSETDDAGTDSGNDTFKDNVTGSDGVSVNATGTTTTDGIPVNFTLLDGSTDCFTDGDNGSESQPAGGSDTGTDNVSDSASGTDSLSVQETGTSSDSAGDSLAFTVNDGTLDSFSASDQGPEGIGTASGSDSFTDSASGSDTFSVHETGSQNLDGFGVSFQLNDSSADSFGDTDNGDVTESSSSGGTGSGTGTGSSSGSGSYPSGGYTTGPTYGGASGTASGSSSGSGTYTSGGYTTDSTSSGGTTGPTYGGGTTAPSISGTDTAVRDTSGSDTFSVHESGTSTDSSGNQVVFSLDDSASDSYTDDGSGSDTESGGVDQPQETSNTDDVTGAAAVGLGESGTVVNNGSTVSLFLKDGLSETYTSDDGTDSSGGNTDDLTAGGSDSFSVHETGTTPTASSLISFSVDASSTGSFSDNDDNIDDPGDVADDQTLGLDDSGTNKASSHEVATDGSSTKDSYSLDSYTVDGQDDDSGSTDTYSATSDDSGVQSFTQHIASGGAYPTNIDTSSSDSFSVHDVSSTPSSGSSGSGGSGVSSATTRTDDGTDTTHYYGSTPNGPDGQAQPFDSTTTTTYHKSTVTTTNPDGTQSSTATTDETITSPSGTVTEHIVTVTNPDGSTSTTVTYTPANADGSTNDPASTPAPSTGDWWGALGLDKVTDAVVQGLDKATGGVTTNVLTSQAFGKALDTTDQFSAGMASALTAGASNRLREKLYGETATKNQQGAVYNAGQLVGTGLNLAIGFGNPCSMTAGVGIGLKAINAVQAVGGSINAYENWQQGNYLGAAADAVGVIGNAATMLKACFAAGTPLLTPTGSKPIDQFRVGDLLLSRDEGYPGGPVEARVVEEVFAATGRILHLHVGGQVIRTTPEHPFYAQGRGWVAAAELRTGDLLSGHDGRWAAVEDLLDTGEYETVYNLRIADYHTYFVGDYDWGFSAWAHNGCHLNSNNAKSNFGLYEIEVNGELYKVGKADLRRVTQSTGLPTRLHQQVRKLGEQFGKDNVTGRVVEELGTVTTQEAKAAETARIQSYFDKLGYVLPGNVKSFKPIVP